MTGALCQVPKYPHKRPAGHFGGGRGHVFCFDTHMMFTNVCKHLKNKTNDIKMAMHGHMVYAL